MNGPMCQTCRRTEAACALMAGRCARCSHFAHLDENGNDRFVYVVDVPRCGEERAYQRHRYLGQPACDACKAAHARHVGARRLAAVS